MCETQSHLAHTREALNACGSPKDQSLNTESAKLVSYLTGNDSHPSTRGDLDSARLIGVLPGCGIGPEVIGAALRVLSAVEQATGIQFQIEQGGAIGEEAESRSGKGLTEPVVEFFDATFRRGGAILNGPGGGRYVYDLRRRFNLFCKFVPVRPSAALANHTQIGTRRLDTVNLLLVRDNDGGVYQGNWQNHKTANGRLAEHSFSYTEAQVTQLVEVAARAAADRRGLLHVIVKEGGVPGITALWREVGFAVARTQGVRAEMMNIDLAGYELIRNPARFDVLVAPNLFGDILADLAGLLVGSRGATYSGNFNASGQAAVYQTNHGCAHDLAGTNSANPAGQILSLAMLLRESLGLAEAASLIEHALAQAWQKGWRTSDLAEPGCRVLGTSEMAEQVAEEVLSLSAEAGVSAPGRASDAAEAVHAPQ